MATRNLTDLTIARLQPAPRGKRVEITDKAQPALKLRVTDTGAKSWTIYFRADDGRHRRLTLGTKRGDFMAVADARKAARTALDKLAEGRDPALDKRAARLARRLEAKRREGADGFKSEHPVGTLAATAEEWLHRHVNRKRLRSAAEYRRIFDVYVNPRLGLMRVGDVTKADVLGLLDDIATRTPTMALRVYARMLTMFRWAEDRGLVSVSPMRGIPKPTEERDRDRVLDDDELRAVWFGSDKLGFPRGAFVKVLMLTGQRRGEVAAMRWSDLDLDGNNQTWTIPRAATKSDRAHEVPLVSAVVDILKAMPRVTFGRNREPSALVFPSPRSGTPLNGWNTMKRRLDALSGVTDWRLHDLRRSAASNMAKARVPRDWVARVLNHSRGASSRDVTAIYDRHDYADEKRIALTRWAERLDAIVTGRTENVVGLGITSRALASNGG